MQNHNALSSENKKSRPSRPRGVTMLALLVLILAVFHLTRFQQSFSRWEFLQATMPIHPAYLLVNGVFWGLAGLILVWAVWFRKAWTPIVLTAAALLYSLSYWFERIFLAGNPNRNINWPFVAALNLLVLAFIAWQLRRKKVIQYFGDMHDT